MTEIVFTIIGVLVAILAAPSIFRRRRARAWEIKGNVKYPTGREIK